MLYKIIINYIRLKLVGIILRRILESKTRKGRQLKTMPIVPYVLELIATYYLRGGKKSVKGNKTIH
ncbi:Uncharacterised protein (plasmid) [Legionella adelaidensis]|uniref:Uncharacterized protein n=1 Tax=Legionella adelaidensis TaxID=45056 RepID=A0A0W0R3H9_9GAMM|nr:hypothetical protein [Legionella adelaidensis]KTC65593.1 hypothetical protein Lade_0251 [Legionella adelaidensis]VEH85210.1 Uncharacterised protein [Legionella adelaidensis]